LYVVNDIICLRYAPSKKSKIIYTPRACVSYFKGAYNIFVYNTVNANYAGKCKKNISIKHQQNLKKSQTKYDMTENHSTTHIYSYKITRYLAMYKTIVIVYLKQN